MNLMILIFVMVIAGAPWYVWFLVLVIVTVLAGLRSNQLRKRAARLAEEQAFREYVRARLG